MIKNEKSKVYSTITQRQSKPTKAPDKPRCLALVLEAGHLIECDAVLMLDGCQFADMHHDLAGRV